MKLTSSIRQTPRIVDPDSANSARQPWSGVMAELVAGAAGCSPYLAGLLGKHGHWLYDAAECNTPIDDLIADLRDSDMIAQDLRTAKDRVALYVGLAELARAQPVLDGTAQLTRFADKAVNLAFHHSIAKYQVRGKLPKDIKWFILAMGKMGAFELNYSSDIDLIILLDDRDLDMTTAHEYRSFMVRASRDALKILSDTSLGGYVFRTDVRLRPDPAVTPICVRTSQALSYYESLGRTWERAAFIKARPCAGDITSGNRFLEDLRPFIWRKYLDFAAIEEAHDLRLKIRDKIKLPGEINVCGHDIKLGRGGIREIEFYTQTRQLISGGRDHSLRHRGTLPALDALTVSEWVKPDVNTALQQHYVRHRNIEHALQMVRDTQTQSIPCDEYCLDVVAALMGQTVKQFLQDTSDSLDSVHSLTEAFFDPPKPETQIPASIFANDLSESWPSYPALRSHRAAKLFAQVRPQILSALADAVDPDDALIQFDAFLKGLPAGVQVFSLFASNPKLVELFTDIVSVSPALAEYLGSSSGVLDSVLSGYFFSKWPTFDILKSNLQAQLNIVSDYEAQLNVARAWRKEQLFCIGVHLLKGLTSPIEACQQYSDVAESILQAVAPLVEAEFVRKYGSVPNASWMILGMGSLGARCLTHSSDLDLMVIFDTDPNALSDGKRPLAGRTYFARLTQSLITALTAPMPDGILYEVDMRLRPSGKAGPVATRIESFESYQRNDAWTWEHLALTRARAVYGDVDLCHRVENMRRDILSTPCDLLATIADVSDMRRRLSAEKPPKGPWDMKNGPGGMMDIELMAQLTALLSGGEGRSVSEQLIEYDELQSIYNRLLALKVLHVVICKNGSKILNMGLGGWKTVNQHCQISDLQQLDFQVSQLRRRSEEIISNALMKGEKAKSWTQKPLIPKVS